MKSHFSIHSIVTKPLNKLKANSNASSSCVWAAVQTKSTRSSSHLMLLMSGDRRSSRQFGERRMLQSKIIWLADCSSAPQMHLGVSRMPQRYRRVPKRPTPVLSLFCATHRLRSSSEPDGRQTAGVTKNWAGGVTLSHATLHDSRILKPSWSAPQHGGGRGVVNAGTVCQETVHCGQGYEGGGWCLVVPGAPAWKWNVSCAGGPVERPRALF